MSVVVLTAVLGATDRLRDPTIGVRGWEYWAATDHPLQSGYWRPLTVDPVPSPLIAARRVKVLAHELFPTADVIIWVDAAFQLQGFSWTLVRRMGTSEIAALPHPYHASLKAEANAIVGRRLASASVLADQMCRYRAEGFHSDGITTTGLLVRRMTPKVRAFNELWWAELERDGHYRDQMSVDYALWKTGLQVASLPGHYRDNMYAQWHKMPDPVLPRRMPRPTTVEGQRSRVCLS